MKETVFFFQDIFYAHTFERYQYIVALLASISDNKSFHTNSWRALGI